MKEGKGGWEGEGYFPKQKISKKRGILFKEHKPKQILRPSTPYIFFKLFMIIRYNKFWHLRFALTYI